MSKRKKTASRGTRSLLRGLRDLQDCVRDGVRPENRFPSRTVGLIKQPGRFSPAAIKKLRASLGVSQSLFATMLGVSSVLVESWEQGLREPSPLARRLLDMIAEDPAAWLARLNRRAG